MQYAQGEVSKRFDDLHRQRTKGGHGKRPLAYAQMSPDALMVALDAAFKAGAKWAGE